MSRLVAMSSPRSSIVEIMEGDLAMVEENIRKPEKQYLRDGLQTMLKALSQLAFYRKSKRLQTERLFEDHGPI